MKTAPAGRFGLEMFERPWTGRVSTTVQMGGVTGPGVMGDDRVGDRAAGDDGAASLSVLVSVRSSDGLRVSVSVALTVGASEADAGHCSCRWCRWLPRGWSPTAAR